MPERRNQRLAVGLPACLEVACQKGDNQADREARIGNLGPHGAFVLTALTWEIDTWIYLLFQLDNHPTPLRVPGRVRWVHPGEGVGVQFIGLCGFDQGALHDFCQARHSDLSRQRRRPRSSSGDGSDEPTTSTEETQ